MSKFPMRAEEIKHPLVPEAKTLITEVANSAAAKFGTLSAFYRHALKFDDRPKVLIGGNQTIDTAKKAAGRQLGKGARKIPDWDLVVWIAVHCTPDPARILPRWAGLWCRAMEVERPPGYTGEIDHELREPDPVDATAELVAGLKAELAEERANGERVARERAAERTHLKAHIEGVQCRLAAEEQAHWRELSAKESLLHQNSTLERRLAKLRADLARANGRVVVLEQSQRHTMEAHTAATNRLHEDLSRTEIERQQLEHRLRQMIGEVTGLVSHFGSLGADVSPRTMTFLPSEVAELLGTKFAPEVDRACRQFALYLRSNLIFAGYRDRDVAAVSASTGIFDAELSALLRGERLPTTEQMDALVSICPTLTTHGFQLLEKARSEELASRVTAPVALVPAPVALVPAMGTTVDNRQRTVTELRAKCGYVDTEPRRRHRPEPPVEVVEEEEVAPAARRQLLPLMGLLVGVVATVGLLGAFIVSAVVSPDAGGDVRRELVAESGTTPTVLNDNSLRWNEFGADPVETGFRTAAQDTALPKLNGLAGTLRLHGSGTCAPVVDVLVETTNNRIQLSLTPGKPLDLASDARLERPADGRFVLRFFRVDTQTCLVSIDWDNPGTT